MLAAGARERTLLEADLVLEVRDVRIGGWPAAAPDAIRVGTMADLAARDVEARRSTASPSSRTRRARGSTRSRIGSPPRSRIHRRAAPSRSS